MKRNDLVSLINRGLYQKLVEITAKYVHSNDGRMAFNELASAINQEFESTWCVIRILEAATGLLEARGVCGEGLPDAACFYKVDPKGTVFEHVLKTKKLKAIDNLADYPYNLLPYTCNGIQAVAVAPIVLQGQAIGTVKLYCSTPRQWLAKEVRQLEALSQLIGLTIETTRVLKYAEKESFRAIIALSGALEFRDPYTHGHSRRVAGFANVTAAALGLNDYEQEQIWRAASMHDVGKIGVPESILFKQGRLSEEEFDIIKRHSAIGEAILKEAELSEAILEAVRHHHERWDGGGYPDGLSGEAIPLSARVLCVCDAYDAMTTNRPYRYAMTEADAMGQLTLHSGAQFDPQVVKAFCAALASNC